jgi:hypothetical protein
MIGGYATAGDEIEAKAYLEEIITENPFFNVYYVDSSQIIAIIS